MDLPGLLLISQSALRINSIKKSLSKTFYVRDCANKDEIWEILPHLNPEFVILDDKTSGIEPLTFCKKFRELRDSVPILVITTNLKKSYTRQLMQAGATDFLREPFEEDDLIYRVEASQEYLGTHQKVLDLSQFIQAPKESESLKKRLIVDERVIDAVSKAHEKHHNLSLLLAEVDKKTKEASNAFEKALKKFLRKQDLMSRIEVGKFVIIMPKTSKSAAHHMGEEIQDAIRALGFTATIGCAELGASASPMITPNQSLDVLLNLATTCLKEAQAQGEKIVSQIKRNKS